MFSRHAIVLLLISVIVVLAQTKEQLEEHKKPKTQLTETAPEDIKTTDKPTTFTTSTESTTTTTTTASSTTTNTTTTYKPTTPASTTVPTSPSPTPTTPSTTTTPTTHAPPTTPAPEPKDWVVSEANKTCIIANMVIKIKVPYKSFTTNKTEDAVFHVDHVKDAKVVNGSKCGPKEQILILSWGNGTTTFNFTIGKDNTSYALSSVKLDIMVNNVTFPNNSWPNVSHIVFKHNVSVFSIPLNHSYTCASVEPLPLNGTPYNKTHGPLNVSLSGSLSVSDVHIEAFGLRNSTNYSQAMDCSTVETPDIVPIVVGLILAGLVVVVLIAYLIGRRRAQARGYLSM